MQSSRARPNAQRHPRTNNTASSVPPWNRITAGTGVSIVLKEDQPTGREVQGVVQDVLTRHDHPRGVKVRLTDGRVGRVQRLVDAARLDTAAAAGGPPVTFEQKFKYRDIRLDDDLEAPPATNDLAAYIKPAKQKKRKGGAAAAVLDDSVKNEAEGESTCPVCNDFKGDEAAVAFHVESHFS